MKINVETFSSSRSWQFLLLARSHSDGWRNGDIKRAAYGYEPTREAVMAAFATSWRRASALDTVAVECRR